MDEQCLLVVGGSGELGQQVVRAAHAAGYVVHATYLTQAAPLACAGWHALDVTDRTAVFRLIEHLKPTSIIHCAVSDRSRPPAAPHASLTQCIVEGGRHVAEAAARVAARCVVLSTDLVFDGRQGHYRETDPPNPIMTYGQAKADMERVVLGLHANTVVVRTSLLLTLQPVGRHIAWIVNALRSGERLKLFTDELRCPVWSDQLALALLELCQLDYCGLLHVAGPEVVSRYTLGWQLATAYDLAVSLIRPALSAESGLRRPLDCSLDCRRAYDMLKTNFDTLAHRLTRM